jgi:hypothetical protein
MRHLNRRIAVHTTIGDEQAFLQEFLNDAHCLRLVLPG